MFCSPDTKVGPGGFWEGGLVGGTRVARGGANSHATALCPGECVRRYQSFHAGKCVCVCVCVCARAHTHTHTHTCTQVSDMGAPHELLERIMQDAYRGPLTPDMALDAELAEQLEPVHPAVWWCEKGGRGEVSTAGRLGVVTSDEDVQSCRGDSWRETSDGRGWPAWLLAGWSGVQAQSDVKGTGECEREDETVLDHEDLRAPADSCAPYAYASVRLSHCKVLGVVLHFVAQVPLCLLPSCLSCPPTPSPLPFLFSFSPSPSLPDHTYTHSSCQGCGLVR